MRGSELRSDSPFSHVDLEARVPAKHPLRAIRAIVDEALSALSADFDAIHSTIGRPSIPPEQLLRAVLLQAFHTVRSERRLMEQLDYNLLFRWFTGLGIDDPVWDVTVFTKNRDRLLDGDIAGKFFAAVLNHARINGLLSDEHFSVDGTLIQVRASPPEGRRSGPPCRIFGPMALQTGTSMKSFRPKDGSGKPPGPGRNGERDFSARVGRRRAPAKVARRARTTPTVRPRTTTPGFIARATAKRASSVSWGMRSWRTATAWLSTAHQPVHRRCRIRGGFGDGFRPAGQEQDGGRRQGPVRRLSGLRPAARHLVLRFHRSRPGP